MHNLSLCSQCFKSVRRRLQNRGHFINKSACTSGTTAIHTHIRGNQLLLIFIIMKENNFRILTAQFNSSTRVWIQCSYRSSICYNFLHIIRTNTFRNCFTTGAAHRCTKLRVWKLFHNLCKQTLHCSALFSMMAFISRINHFIFCCI